MHTYTCSVCDNSKAESSLPVEPSKTMAAVFLSGCHSNKAFWRSIVLIEPEDQWNAQITTKKGGEGLGGQLSELTLCREEKGVSSRWGKEPSSTYIHTLGTCPKDPCRLLKHVSGCTFRVAAWQLVLQ